MGKLTFEVNGEQYSVSDHDVSSDMMLVDYLRTRLELRGTKFMCREAGCGACIVSVISPDGTPMSVNSCMVCITQCHGWKITTIEKVGNKLNGYHPIQKTMAECHATQCGHCTPGFVMAMYSLAQTKKDLTQLEIENSFGSNICRCTGYRPIMDAMKKFAKDAPDSRIADIEDLYICKKTSKPCYKSCHEDDEWYFVSNLSLEEEEPIEIELKDGKKWYKATEIKHIFDILSKLDNVNDSMLVCGNTAKGPYPIDEYPNCMIDITGIKELKGHYIDQNLVIGANNTLTELIDIFETVSEEDNFEYLKKCSSHVQLIAHIPVRNIGSIAGNLMTKHRHNEFPSDIFMILETLGAFVTIYDAKESKQVITIQDFLNMDMKYKIIYNIILPPLNSEYHLHLIKVMPRAQNAHAIVNSGMLCQLDSNNTVLSIRIVLGGLSPSFFRPYKTEEHLKGKSLFENETLQSSLKVMEQEIVIEDGPQFAYKKQLAFGTFYKSLLTLCPDDMVGVRYMSGRKRLYESRPVSKALQDFSTDEKLYPLNQPIQKVEGLIQCAGEAQYTEDLPTMPHEVYAALVLATIPRGNIESIDASEALEIPGVVAFYSAKDIPGKNSFMLLGQFVFIKDEELFCSEEVKYYNQPLGVVVADSTAIAERAAKRVKVTYINVKKPMLDINEAKNDKDRTRLFLPIPAIGRGLFVHKKFESNYTVRGQMHFCMETVVCIAKPSEFGLEVHSTTQWMDAVQNAVAKALDIDISRVDVFSRRLGGAFGLKVTRASLTSVACSLVAYKLNRPCRMIQSFSSVARALGKRFPSTCDVKVEVGKEGRIQHINYDIYEDNGYIVSELVSILGVDTHNNCYKSLWWDFKCYDSTTDTASNTYCRSPGSVENITMAENVMEQISYELGLDPFDVRITNMNTLLYGTTKKIANELKETAEYEKRKAEVEQYNSDNRWTKRGLRWAFLRYTPLCPCAYEVSMSVCHGDGSVIINHSGVEIGQGINTKAIQICAHFFGISCDLIQVKPHNTITGCNSIFTAASVTSQSIGMGVEKCCKDILARLAPFRVLLLNPSWPKLIKTAYTLKCDLQARHFVNNILSPVHNVYGVALAEVEADILTGECQVRRVDLLEDVGQSVSPQIDVGQVEGAFVMGLGYFMFEELVYDPDTGELKTDRPWSYNVPQCKDIPQDYRIYFRKKSYSSAVVLGSKVTGEPATVLPVSVAFAIRQCISSARSDAGESPAEYFRIDGPHTTEKVCTLSKTKLEHFLYR